jgi:hypothetical protein
MPVSGSVPKCHRSATLKLTSELGNLFCALFKVKIPKFFDEDLTFIFTTQVETPQQERERERERERFCFICLNDDQQLN